MLRIFLKQEAVYALKSRPAEQQQHLEQFNTTCLRVIETFKRLMKAVYPPPLSDFKLRQRL